MDQDLQQFLLPGPAIDCDDPDIIALAAEIVAAAEASDDVEKAEALFLWVRDKIAYTMHAPFWDLEFYRARSILRAGQGYCVQKSALLCTLARAAGIPARMCFVDIDNMAIGPEIVERMNGRTFTYHSYTKWFIGGQWQKATPAFDAKLCHDHGYPVVEFVRGQDLLLPAKTLAGDPYIVYGPEHGCRDGVPLDEILDAWRKVYGPDSIEHYRGMMEAREQGA